MKRIPPRFSRCFLIAALVAAVAGPLAPTGAAAGDSVVCDDPPGLAPPELAVSPDWSLVPGRWITVVGSGFTGNARVTLVLEGGGAAVVVAGEGAADRTSAMNANAHGTFIYRGWVPFDDEVTATHGKKTWMATDQCGRSARSSNFKIEERKIYMRSLASPGATVSVSGRGWGVLTPHGRAPSQVTITLEDRQGRPMPYANFGPFAVNEFGWFDGRITVPPYARGEITVIATDNNGPLEYGGTGGFSANQTVQEVLRVAPGVVTITPNPATTGEVITISGTGFPARTALSELNFGLWNALPVPAPATDVNGNFTVTLVVPRVCSPGASCPPPPYNYLVCVTAADVVGCTEFTIPDPQPSITLSTQSARPGDTITITGTGFSPYANVDTINVGQTSVTPTPNLLTDVTGSFSASVVLPPLTPGAYTVAVRTGGGRFTATAGILVLGKKPKPPEEAFQALISRGLLTLAAAKVHPGETEFGAYVPGLPGDTLTLVEPGGVLVLTLAKDAQISVSGQPAVDVAADTPTFFALGPDVSVEVIEHDP